MEFHDNYPNYEMMAHHSEEEGKIKRKKLWRVFWIMFGITILELFIGFYAGNMGLLDEMRRSTLILKFIFVGLTIVKAAYIVLSFMHLGDEKKILKYTILGPYTLFVAYLIWIILTEGTYSSDPGRKASMDKNVIQQQTELNAAHQQHGGSQDEHGEGTKQKSSH